MKSISTTLRADLKTIRNQNPLILNLTNYVAMDFTANALLAVGASPIMTHEEKELPDLVALCHSIVINIGTIDNHFLSSVFKVLKEAEKLKKPVVLDPVGAGASSYRLEATKKIMQSHAIAAIRGNASEIAAILEDIKTDKGVDSSLSSDFVFKIAQEKIKDFEPVFVISGETDYILSKEKKATNTSGCALMAQVTAMGCTASALIGAFLALSFTPFESCLQAMRLMGIAGEIAQIKATGPGSFRVAFLDALHNMEHL